MGEEDKSGLSSMQQQAGVKNKLENWEQQLLSHPSAAGLVFDVKQENPLNTYVYGGGHGGNVEFPAKSCVTSLSSNMLDFSNKSDARHPPPDHSSEVSNFLQFNLRNIFCLHVLTIHPSFSSLALLGFGILCKDFYCYCYYFEVN